MKKIIIIIFIISLLLESCTTSGGGDWLLVDFNKQENNYRDIKEFVSKIYVGMPKSQLLDLFHNYIEIVQVTKEYEILGIAQWEAALGNDYIIRVLYIKIIEKQVDSFIIRDISAQRITIPIFIWI